MSDEAISLLFLLDALNRIASLMEMSYRIKITKGDITKQPADAIVNAANTSLLGGGGVDGAIHRAAGPGLLEECQAIGGCPTGSARITKGYNLPAKYVIHTVGPVWCGGKNNEAEILARCYRSCLELAAQYEIKTIAFPSISTGAYHFPVELASVIAIRAIRHLLNEYRTIKNVIIVCYDDKTYRCYQAIISRNKKTRESPVEGIGKGKVNYSTSKKQLFDSLIVKIRETIVGAYCNTPLHRDEKLRAVCRLLNANVHYYNWVGFYLVSNDKPTELILGPYVGEPTEHTRIPFSKGICGQAAERKKPFIVQDVTRATNYLACSPKVKSEIVVPIIRNSRILGELDIDSDTMAPFTKEDTVFLEEVCLIISNLLY